MFACARRRKTLLFFPIYSILRTARAARPTFRIDLLIFFLHLYPIHVVATHSSHVEITFVSNTEHKLMRFLSCIFDCDSCGASALATLKMKSSRRKEKISLLSLSLSIESITTSALAVCARKCLRMRTNYQWFSGTKYKSSNYIHHYYCY